METCDAMGFALEDGAPCKDSPVQPGQAAGLGIAALEPLGDIGGIEDIGAWRAEEIPFSHIVHQYSSMVYSIALHFLRDGGLAEDIAQEAFLRLSKNLGGIKSEKHLALWLRRATARLCIDEKRKFSKRFVPLESIPEPISDQTERDFLADGAIRAMVAELPQQSRMALILRYQEDLSPPEIADILREPVNTVKSRLQRALAALRQKLLPKSEEARDGQWL